MQKAFTDGQDALKKGDWTAYGEAQKRPAVGGPGRDRRRAERIGDRPGALGYDDAVAEPDHQVAGMALLMLVAGSLVAFRLVHRSALPGRVGAHRGLRASLTLLLVAVGLMVATTAIGGRVVPAVGMLAAGGDRRAPRSPSGRRCEHASARKSRGSGRRAEARGAAVGGWPDLALGQVPVRLGSPTRGGAAR